MVNKNDLKINIMCLKVKYLLLAIPLFFSCQEKYEDVEVYKKLIYIVDSENTIAYLPHQFQEEASEGFISLYCGGSLMSDKDVDIKMTLDDELIEKYNYFEFENDVTKYVKALPKENYSIPSLSLTMKSGEACARMPINIKTNKLSPDETYVIPLKIESLSNYEINPKLSKILYGLKLQNEYSGLYNMSGTITKIGGKPQNVFKSKTVVALEKNICRIYIATESEDKENIATHTLTFNVENDNKVTINNTGKITDLGKSYYDPEKKAFCLNYRFEKSGEDYDIREVLLLIPEK